MKQCNIKLNTLTKKLKSYRLQAGEEGITLVISIILLASTTFISFSLSTVIIREIRSAQTILQAEPAISGANSGGEIGMFRFLREVGGTATSGQTPQSGASYSVVADLYDLPYFFSSTTGKLIKVGLYDAEQPRLQSADYGTVTVINDQGSSPLKVDVFSWSDLTTTVWSTTIGSGSSGTSPNLNSVDDRYLIMIDPVPASGNASGQIRATDNSGASKGVPSPNPGIDVTGTSGGVQRKIEIDFQ